MELKQVIKDIKSGKSKAIYLCSKSLWWTHLDSDLDEANQKGINFKINVLKKSSFSVVNNVPDYLSPIGEKIIVNLNPKKFIEQTQMKPQHFGKHGLKAFMKAHHQNNSMFFYNKWIKYNKLIDKLK